MRATVAIAKSGARASSLWQRIRARDAATGLALSTLAIMGMTKKLTGYVPVPDGLIRPQGMVLAP